MVAMRAGPHMWGRGDGGISRAFMFCVLATFQGILVHPRSSSLLLDVKARMW